MSDSTLYDDDILLWSEQQAAVIRRLRETERGLPNELDIENVAEEIESVGRSELAAVKSYLRVILVHLIKLAAEGNATSAAHWRGEIAAFRHDLLDRYARSMHAKIDLDRLWLEVRERIVLDPGVVSLDPRRLPSICPIELDNLVGERMDIDALATRLRQVLDPGERASDE
jgi:hypothetical protein